MEKETSFKKKNVSASSPLRHAGLDAAGAPQSWQGVLPVGAVAGAAQAHVDGLAAGVHAAHRGVAQAAARAHTVAPQRALPALGSRWAAEGGAPRQAVGGARGGVHRPWAGGLPRSRKEAEERELVI